MRIAIDVMGGDYAPHEIVAGVVQYALKKNAGVELILVGDTPKIEKCLQEQGSNKDLFEIVHASQVVTMGESPAVVLRKKKDSSISVAMRLTNEGKADAVVSAGNTGAVVAAAKIECGMLPGIDRPAIATLIPGPFGASILIDSGATVNCKSENLLQFAQMGSCYANVALHRSHPLVGLISIGAEDAKGNSITRETYSLLRESSLHFYGNVEGQDFLRGKVDVIVCDGFVGNVALKVMEGMADGLKLMIEKLTYQQPWWKRLHLFLLNLSIKKIDQELDSKRYGGAPLLGVNCICVCAHGNSSKTSISNAIERTVDLVEQQLNLKITEALTK